ncbi:MAG: YeeE/YedE thiosulfate transporter family protein, partial [Heliobacteriaceae bacterium]|nr:YeeE/YedE thiosulfate transporter family protein [Heliobacteriaceae bacterium]
LSQRSRFCLVGGVRDAFVIKDFYLLKGLLAVFVGVTLTNLALGFVNVGFTGQPIAHTQHVWNFLGLGLVGLASTLIGGCPFRQLVLAGEGDADAGAAILGMLAGAAVAHNFLTAAAATGTTLNGQIALVGALVITLLIGLTAREA